jgi:hypothetical protein
MRRALVTLSLAAALVIGFAAAAAGSSLWAKAGTATRTTITFRLQPFTVASGRESQRYVVSRTGAALLLVAAASTTAWLVLRRRRRARHGDATRR